MMRYDDRNEDKPPYSRVFIVCNKHLGENDLRPVFEKFGHIEALHIPKDRFTGEPKGIAYIKYEKTSSAATAIQELHQKMLENCNKPLKVMVASHKSDNYKTNEDKYKRLFIKINKEISESGIRDHFSTFGCVESVRIQKDKVTEENKGFAYVNYRTFLDAAKAFEQCDRIFKPIFATPQDELKRNRTSLEGYIDSYHSGSSNYVKENNEHYHPPRENIHSRDSVTSLIKPKSNDYDTVSVTCTPQVPQKYIEKLFNIVPGLMQCQYSVDKYNGLCKATINYETEKAAAYAVEKLNNFEFPSGEIISVKPVDNILSKAANNLNNIVNSFKNSIDNTNPDLAQLAEAIAQASSLIKVVSVGREAKSENLENYCSVKLPPPQPTVNGNQVAKRCFIVFKPHPPPPSVLRDAFSRFGDLIDVCTFPNKTFGFARFASVKSALEAIKTLHGATLCGIKLKVIEADEKPSQVDEENVSTDHDMEVKRMKLDDKDEDNWT